MLTPAEERRIWRRRRKVALIIVGIVVALVVAYFTLRPLLGQARAWQARRHASKAMAFIEQEKWADARTEASAAYQLRPTEPQALRAVARLLSRTRQADAFDFWRQLEKREPLTRVDLRDKLSISLAAGDLAAARDCVEGLLDERNGKPAAADWVLAAQFYLQNRARDKAQPLIEKVLADPAASEREQLQAALLQITSSVADNSEAAQKTITSAWKRLTNLAKARTSVALDALVILANHLLSLPPASSDVGMSGAEIVQALEAHPLAKAPQKLLAQDLKIHDNPAERETIIKAATAQWKDADPISLNALGTWLNGKREYQRELDTITLEQSLKTKELFLQRLDALGGLGRWAELKELLQADRFALDPVIQQMYLARSSAQLGERAATENHWQRALEMAHNEPQKLLLLADYAERNGAIDVAENAYTAADTEEGRLRPAIEGRVRIAHARGETQKMQGLLAAMLRNWPNDPAVQNDEAYARLLLTSGDSEKQKRSAAEIEQLGADLAQREPASLAHRTLLALARLKQGRTADALAVYNELRIAQNALTPGAVAVHAAVLAANGKADDARKEIKQLKPELLLPEERALIQALL
jgi:ribosomal protein L22